MPTFRRPKHRFPDLFLAMGEGGPRAQCLRQARSQPGSQPGPQTSHRPSRCRTQKLASRPPAGMPAARHPPARLPATPRAAREQPASSSQACQSPAQSPAFLPSRLLPVAPCPGVSLVYKGHGKRRTGKTPSLQVHRVVGINRLIRHKALLRGMQLQIVCVFQHAMIQFHLPPFQHSCARLNQAKYCRLSGHKKKRSHVIDRSSATFWVLIIIRVHVAHEAVQHCSSELSTRR